MGEGEGDLLEHAMMDLYHTADSTQVLDDTPHVCPRCQQNHYWFVNKGEHTVCIHCAMEEEKKQ